MKRLIPLLLIVVLLAGGCRNVTMSPRYSMILDQTTAITREVAQRADTGMLSTEDTIAALRYQYAFNRLLQDARDGKAGTSDPQAYLLSILRELDQ